MQIAETRKERPMRVTVKIREKGETGWREFHLEQSRAERFAGKVIADGGEATIGPLAMSSELCAMLASVGVAPAKIT
jgi:hypothetical protein